MRRGFGERCVSSKTPRPCERVLMQTFQSFQVLVLPAALFYLISTLRFLEWRQTRDRELGERPSAISVRDAALMTLALDLSEILPLVSSVPFGARQSTTLVVSG